MEAKNLIVGSKYKSGKTVQEVTKIVEINNKTITYYVRRIHPEISEHAAKMRKSLATILQSAD